MNWFKRWRKELFIIIGVIALAVGGVILANELGKTGDIALDDDFTSSFIDRDVKVDEGFHFFESKNGKYTMWLPAGYYLKDGYEAKDYFENLHFYKPRDGGEGFSRDIHVMYKFYEDGQSTIYEDGEPLHSAAVDLRLEMLLDDSSYNNEHEKIETEGAVIYHGSSHRGLKGTKGFIADPKESYANEYFALVHNLGGDQVITIQYGIFCPEDEEPSCIEGQEQEAQFFDTFIRNIKFR